MNVKKSITMKTLQLPFLTLLLLLTFSCSKDDVITPVENETAKTTAAFTSGKTNYNELNLPYYIAGRLNRYDYLVEELNEPRFEDKWGRIILMLWCVL